MTYLFLVASAQINYVKDGVTRQLYKLLCRLEDGTQVECVTSSVPSGEVVIAKFVKKDEVLYTNATGPVVAKEDQWNVQYYTTKEMFARAKAAKAAVTELTW